MKSEKCAIFDKKGLFVPLQAVLSLTSARNPEIGYNGINDKTMRKRKELLRLQMLLMQGGYPTLLIFVRVNWQKISAYFSSTVCPSIRVFCP